LELTERYGVVRNFYRINTATRGRRTSSTLDIAVGSWYHRVGSYPSSHELIDDYALVDRDRTTAGALKARIITLNEILDIVAFVEFDSFRQIHTAKRASKANTVANPKRVKPHNLDLDAQIIGEEEDEDMDLDMSIEDELDSAEEEAVDSSIDAEYASDSESEQDDQHDAMDVDEDSEEEEIAIVEPEEYADLPQSTRIALRLYKETVLYSD
jgi:hypothetical protein